VQAQQCTGSLWLRWIGEQIAGAVGYIEAEERAQSERLLVTTEQLETARSRIRCLEKDLDQVTAEMAKMALTATQIQSPVTPVSVQNKETDRPVHTNKTPATETVPARDAAQAQELAELRDELAAQEALRSRERELKTAAEAELKKTAENLRRAEESLRKGHQAYDRLKEEKDKVLQEKDKLRKTAETEIERLKEELRQQKDREDRARRQINARLKQKTDDFEHLHRDYKRLET
jgi:chromosome segregation ATPase